MEKEADGVRPAILRFPFEKLSFMCEIRLYGEKGNGGDSG
jgi:hypothetical protein